MKKIFYALITFYVIFLSANSLFAYTTISGVVTCSTNTVNATNIVIQANARFIVTATLQMAAGKRIIVHKRGVLEVDGGTITHVNSNELWGGIVAYGTPNHYQPPHLVSNDNVLTNYNYFANRWWAEYFMNQAVVYLHNNAKISYALGAVTLGTREVSGNNLELLPNYGGAFLYADNTTFSNNFGWSIAACGYKNSVFPNVSNIQNCSFYVDQNCPVSMGTKLGSVLLNNSHTFIALQSESSIRYFGLNNTFTRSNNTDPFIGFIVYYSRLDLCPSNSGSSGTCTISNLDIGIYFQQHTVFWQSNSIVDGVTLTNNKAGINTHLGDLITIRNNTFSIKPSTSTVNYGIYFDGTSGYLVNDNTFTKTSGNISSTSAGIYANSSGNGNLIKNNTFNNIPRGVQAQDNNLGLQLKCNNFNNLSRYDVIVTSGGIASPQGFSYNPANNEFSQIGTYSTSDFHQNSGVSNVDYYYNTGCSHCEPYFYSNSVYPKPQGGNKNNDLCTQPKSLLEKYQEINNINSALDELDPVEDADEINYLTVTKDYWIAEIFNEYEKGGLVQVDSLIKWEPTNQIEDLYDFLENEECFSAKYYLMYLYLRDNNYTDAYTLINYLDEQYPEDEEIQSFCEYNSIIIECIAEDWDLEFLNSKDEDILEIAQSGTFISNKAKNLLEYIHWTEAFNDSSYYNEEYPFVFEDADGSEGESMSLSANEIKFEDQFDIYPNPVRNFLEISLNSSTKYEFLTTLTDLAGKILINCEISNNGILNIDLKNLPAGIYFIKISDLNNKISVTKRLLKTNE